MQGLHSYQKQFQPIISLSLRRLPTSATMLVKIGGAAAPDFARKKGYHGASLGNCMMAFLNSCLPAFHVESLAQVRVPVRKEDMHGSAVQEVDL